jgi:hypothetical protein
VPAAQVDLGLERISIRKQGDEGPQLADRVQGPRVAADFWFGYHFAIATIAPLVVTTHDGKFQLYTPGALNDAGAAAKSSAVTPALTTVPNGITNTHPFAPHFTGCAVPLIA